MALKTLTRRERIKKKIRSQISGTSERPRISVFRSNKYIYAQAIDDKNGKTLAAASSVNSKGTATEKSIEAGKQLAEKLTKSKISEIVFDRNGFQYTGKVKALADSIRENGIKF